MRVASWSRPRAPTRSRTASGFFSRYAAPRRSSSARESTQPSGSPSAATASASSMTTTWSRAGSSARHSRTLASCAAFSAISTLLSESERMKAVSSVLVEG